MGLYDINYSEKEEQNIYLSDTQKGFELIAKLIANTANKQETAALLDNMKKLIKEDFADLCRTANLPEQIEIYGKLWGIYEDIKAMTEFSALANKNIVAFGGGFSAGKSRLINSILGENILPYETTPTTSIPTYVRSGETEHIYALNTFNVRADMDREAIKAISHDFNKQYNISFSHVIKLLMLETPAFPYDNIALLDTPGYSKADSLQEGANTDEKKAKEHLSQADYLIWVINVKNGTLPDTDIGFLNSIDYDGEIFFIVNRADEVPPHERIEVMDNVKARISDSGLKSAGLLLFSSTEEQKELSGDSIFQYLDSINSKLKSTNIKKRVKKLISSMLAYINDEKDMLGETIGYFNKFILNNIADQSGDMAPVREVLTKTKEQVKKHEIAISNLIVFADRFNEAVDKILRKILIVDEAPSDAGIETYQSINDKDKLCAMDIDQELQGNIKTVNAFGVFIQSQACGEIMIARADISKKYTADYRELFSVGENCLIKIKDIEHSKKRVKLIIIPNTKES